MRNMSPISAAFLLWTVLSVASHAQAQERRAYEGVVSWKQATIGTVIMAEITDNTVSGWLRLEKPVAIDGGSVVENGMRVCV